MSMPAATGARSRNPTGGPQVSYGKSVGGQRPFSMQQFTPEQMDLFSSLFGHLGPDSFLGRLAKGGEDVFKDIEAPAWKQFQGVQGQLGSRFSGMGTGARRSSGFQNTMNQAGSDFAEALQSQRLGLQNQAIKDLLGMSNELLGQRPYQQGFLQKGPSAWQQLLGSLGGIGGQFLGGLGGGLGGNIFSKGTQTQGTQGKVT